MKQVGLQTLKEGAYFISIIVFITTNYFTQANSYSSILFLLIIILIILHARFSF